MNKEKIQNFILNTKTQFEKDIVEPISKEVARSYIPHGLESEKQYQERVRLQVTSQIDQSNMRLMRATKILKDKNLWGEEFSKTLEEVIDDASKASQKAEQGESLQAILKIDIETMIIFHGVALDFYEKGDLESTCDLYFLLTTLNGHIGDFWMGLALCQYKLHNLEGAALAFMCWGALSADDLTPYFHAAKCYVALGDKEMAQEALKIAMQRISECESLGFFKEEALSMEQTLK